MPLSGESGMKMPSKIIVLNHKDGQTERPIIYECIHSKTIASRSETMYNIYW